MPETDFTQYNIGPEAGAPPLQVVPTVVGATLLLPPGTFGALASATAAFGNITFFPFADVFVFADTSFTVKMFIRQSSLDTFRQLGASIVCPANVMSNPFSRQRVPSTDVAFSFTNGAVIATVVSIEIILRSL